MAKLYIKYTPSRIGLTGTEYLPGFLDEHYPNITFSEVISDGFNRFGVLEGDGDELYKMLMALTTRFSIRQLSEEELIGYAKLYYNPIELEDGNTLSFADYMSGLGFTIADEVVALRAAKKDMFKELVKKRLQPDNESIADVMKSFVLFTFYYDTLTADEKSAVDAKTDVLKNVYTKAKCIDAYTSLVDKLNNIVTGYYNVVNTLEDQTDPDLIKSIMYE